MRIRVDCEPGHEGEEAPRRLYLGQRPIDVAELVDSWLAPEHRYFKIIGTDGAILILRHDVGRDHWEMVLFRSEGRPT